MDLYYNPIKIGRIDFGNNLNLLRCGCFLAGAFFFCKKSPGTPNTVFLYVLGILQGQFWTGIGYIDADRKVSMTQTGLILNSWAKVQESVKHVPKQCISTGFGKVRKSRFLTAGL